MNSPPKDKGALETRQTLEGFDQDLTNVTISQDGKKSRPETEKPRTEFTEEDNCFEFEFERTDPNEEGKQSGISSSSPCPAELIDWCRQDWAKSGISPAQAESRGLCPIEGDPISKILGFTPQTKGKPIQGYSIPFSLPDDTPQFYAEGKQFTRVRLRFPHFGENGKPAKYLSPSESGIHLYILKQVHDYFMNNPLAALFLTEGEKKVICAWFNHRFPVLGLTGIWGWMKAKGDKSINPELVPYILPGRKIYMIYDSDATETPEKAKAFEQCTADFANALFEHDATMYRVDLPKGEII